jgi:hypothetical protein
MLSDQIRMIAHPIQRSTPIQMAMNVSLVMNQAG